jgi:hypothetical protein
MAKKFGSDGGSGQQRPSSQGTLGKTVRKDPLVAEEKKPQLPVEETRKPI